MEKQAGAKIDRMFERDPVVASFGIHPTRSLIGAWQARDRARNSTRCLMMTCRPDALLFLPQLLHSPFQPTWKSEVALGRRRSCAYLRTRCSHDLIDAARCNRRPRMNNELVHTNHLSSGNVIMISIVYLHIL